MSNLLKYNHVVVKNEDKHVIDSNELLKNILSAKKNTTSGNSFAEKSIADPDGFVRGIDAARVEKLISDEEEQQDDNNAGILEDARKQAEDILEDAKKQAEDILKDARENGYKEGYEKGTIESKQKSDGLQAKLEADYKSMSEKLQNEYDEKYQVMESELVDTLMEVFSKVTLTIAEDKKDLVLLLIQRTLKDADANKDFLIRVSDVDYGFVMNSIDKLYDCVSLDSKIEVVRDNTLKKNQCIIETDAGAFDCSLDIQLEGLISEIKLLSCLNKQ